VVIAERVLSECVGSPAVMAEQCAHTADLAESGKIRLHVVPAGAVVGFGGAVAIAVKDGHVTVNFTVLTRDIPTTATAVTDEVMSAFEALMGAALPAAESVGCVRRWEAIWKEQT
jgi:hypothetical protein